MCSSLSFKIFDIQKFSVADITLQGHSRSSMTTWIDSEHTIFPLTFNNNWSSTLHRFQDTTAHWSKIENFSYTAVFTVPSKVIPSKFWQITPFWSNTWQTERQTVERWRTPCDSILHAMHSISR